MPVAIEVPGLDAFAPEIPDGGLVLLEGDASPAKGHLARTIGRSAAARKRRATLLTTREGEAAAGGLAVHPATAWPRQGPPKGHDLVIDSFSLLALGQSPADLVERVRSLRRDGQAQGRIVVLVLDDGQLDAASRSACHHLADGVIQFHSREDADGVLTFLRIPKWMGKPGPEKHLFYGFDGRQMLIDTRRRVT